MTKPLLAPDPSRRAFRQMIRNVPFDALTVGQSATLERRIDADDLMLFAHAAGGAGLLQPAPVDLDGDGQPDAAAPAAFLVALVGSLLNTRLPGPGTLIRRLSVSREGLVRAGETVRITVTCQSKGPAPAATFSVQVATLDAVPVLRGTVDLDAPVKALEVEGVEGPGLIIDRHDLFAGLLARACRLPPLPTAVVCPDEKTALAGAMLAAEAGLIRPLLIGRAEGIAAAAHAAGLDLAETPILDIADPAEAAARAVALVRLGEVGAVMKGNLHSDTLLAEVVKKDTGLRTGRRVSHVFALDVPTLDHLLFITDAAINIAPDLATKVDIVQNAIDLAQACGMARPKVGVLSAVETVNPAIPSTIDAAVLAKMAERGQIKGGIVDGPLAMDNAMDMEAARTKGIASLVAGRADVLVVPNIEAGNMLAKELIFVGRAQAAGLVVGARVPVILTSRADDARTRLASCALAQLLAYRMRHGVALTDETALDVVS